MRAVWSGTISFGLVAMPVRLYAATEERSVRLREVHAADGGRVRHRRWCEAEDREIPYGEVGRGWELPDGRLLPLSEVELERLPLPTRRVVDVVGFVQPAALEPVQFQRAYYVGPDSVTGPGARPYTLLAQALERTGLVGVCRVAIRSRERLAALYPRPGGVLVLHTLLWADEVRQPGEGLVPAVEVTERELELAEVLIRELVGVEVGELRDEYRRALEALVEAKLAGEEPPPVPEPAPVVDLMAALEESVRQARAGRSGG